MSGLVDHLVNLTTLRDRDALDVALVNTVFDLIKPISIAILKVVGDQGNERWLSCARMVCGQESTISDSYWETLELLPVLSEHPVRLQSMQSRQIVQKTGDSCFTVFPMSDKSDSSAVLEIQSCHELSADVWHMVSGILRLYFNFQNLLDYGERDALTELLNRKTFDNAFMKATVDQCTTMTNLGPDRRDFQAQSSYWLAMIDIDHFKRVNDNFGHLIGDEVLLLLSRLMRSKFRFHDQLYRFGGEEFVVLMRCHGDQETAMVLERMRSATQAFVFPQVGCITISIGFSEIRTGDTPSGAFERADKALYYAKSNGRNQVSSFSALVATGDLVEQVAKIGDMELF